MIIDKIKNTSNYYGIGERIFKALKFIQEKDIASMELGTYEIEGSDIYAIVLKYDTIPMKKGLWEAHKKYIDVQYIIDGIEQIGYANIDDIKLDKKYVEEEDYCLYKGEGNMIVFKTGSFGIFAPQDAHMPGISLKEPQQVKKIVVKVRV